MRSYKKALNDRTASIKQSVSEINKVEIAHINMQPELASYVDKEILELILEDIKNISNEFSSLDFGKIPYRIVAKSDEVLKNTNSVLSTIVKFNFLTAPNVEKSWEQQFEQIQENHNQLYEVLVPVFASSNVKIDFERIRKEFDTEASGMINRLKVNEVESERIKQSLQNIVQESGVEAFAQIFDEDSEKYRKASNSWLLATVTFGLLTIGWGFASFEFTAEGSDMIIQYAISKLMILSLLVFGTTWSAKNFRANRHNSVVFRQKNNTLRIFRTFIESTADEDTKNAIRLHAAQYIFSQQSTGYGNNDNDSEQPSKIIEIIKSVGGSNKG